MGLAFSTVSCHLSIMEEDGRLSRDKAEVPLLYGEDRGTTGASAGIGLAKPHRLIAIFQDFCPVCYVCLEHRFVFLSSRLLASN